MSLEKSPVKIPAATSFYKVVSSVKIYTQCVFYTDLLLGRYKPRPEKKRKGKKQQSLHPWEMWISPMRPDMLQVSGSQSVVLRPARNAGMQTLWRWGTASHQCLRTTGLEKLPKKETKIKAPAQVKSYTHCAPSQAQSNPAAEELGLCQPIALGLDPSFGAWWLPLPLTLASSSAK